MPQARPRISRPDEPDQQILLGPSDGAGPTSRPLTRQRWRRSGMGDTARSGAPSTNLDMFTMVVLRRRIEAIIREMTSALFRSGRSGVLNTAMDFSCSLTDAQFRSVSVALGLPVHV